MILLSAVEEPTEPMSELCQSAAYAMMCGQWRADTLEATLMAEAVSARVRIARSAIGLRSWSCGGLSV